VPKKKQHQNPPKAKEFHVTPFGALKGMPVVAEILAGSVKSVAITPPESVDDSMDLFLQAVSDVRPLQTHAKKPAKTGLELPQKTADITEEQLPAVEKGAFLEEIGRLKLDTRFADNIPNEGELQPLSGNRLRQVKRGIVSVDHQLDLHGLTREEALDALPAFLLSAQKHGQKAVLIITGKGKHSPDVPVLHQTVASWLRDTGRAMVVEFAPAPREMGGDGAYVIFLRQLLPST
jgi:DNA-nicking Smr family endonuclease